MRKPVLSLLGVLFVVVLHAQEQFGIALGNYAGTDAIALNPARGATQWLYMDIRLFGADLRAWNDLVSASVNERSLAGELRNSVQGSAPGTWSVRELLSPNDKRAVVQASVLGPGMALSLGRGTIGVGIRSRAHVSITDVPAQLGRHIFHGFGFAEQRNVRQDLGGPRVMAAAWTEASVSYAHLLMARDFNLLSVGITARYMIAHAGAAFNLDELSYTSMDSARLEFHRISGAYGLAAPEVAAGRGFGGDLGVVYERSIDEADGYMPHRSGRGCTPLAYRYRIGVSLLDLGGIRFREARAGTFEAGALALPNYNATGIEGLDELDSLLSTAVDHRPTTGMRIGAPTAIAVQYDHRLAQRVFLGFTGVQHLSFPNGNRLRRANVMALVPRWETRYLEVAIPITLQEYDLRRPGIGASLRVNGIMIGSDDLRPLFGRRDVRSIDLYFRVKWLIHRSPFCKGKRPDKERRAPGAPGAMPCAMPGSSGG
ncbi:MAG: DUF5723 family protein [Flavobacteriales bacterium]|jgi:hypothetical protein|nr:DUF5723 family protein [Flavobacteriales bacterium]